MVIDCWKCVAEGVILGSDTICLSHPYSVSTSLDVLA